MTCFDPILAYQSFNPVTGELLNNGKPKIIKFKDKKDKLKNFQFAVDNIEKHSYSRVLYFPCGKCDGCHIDYSRDWANRLTCELDTCLEDGNKAYFITLTYNDESLKYNEYFSNGIPQKVETLYPKDLTDFWKKIRKRFKIRYYVVGEYGQHPRNGGHGRPHYHAIVYGLNLDDLEYHGLSKTKQPIYISPWLTKKWGLGYVTVQNVEWKSCAYVARYCNKKLYSHNIYYQEYNIEPEFSNKSLKPGIGYDYYERHKDEMFSKVQDSDGQYRFKSRAISFPQSSYSISFDIPKYFRKCHAIEHPEVVSEYNEFITKFAKDKQELIMSKTDLDFINQRYVDGQAFAKRVSKLDIERRLE